MSKAYLDTSDTLCHSDVSETLDTSDMLSDTSDTLCVSDVSETPDTSETPNTYLMHLILLRHLRLLIHRVYP